MSDDAVQELSGKLGLDTTDFKTATIGANRELRVLESGFRASAVALGDWSQDATGLEMRIKSLTQQADLQATKVRALEQEHRRLADSGDASRGSLDKLQITINQENERLGKMQNELGQSSTALAGMGKDSNKAAGEVETLKKKEDEATASTSKLSGVLGGLGTALKAGGAALAGVAVGVAGIAAGITGLVLKTAATADSLAEMSDKTGISTTRLQEMQYIADQTGTGLETMTGSLAKLTKNMDAALTAGSPAAEAFGQLGVSVQDSNGQLRDADDVFNEAINQLGKMTNETERDALAMKIFGKSAQELNPLIVTGAAGLAQMAADAHALGAVMSEEDVKAAADLNDKIGALKAGFQGMLMTLAGPLVSGFSTAADTVTGFAKRLAEIIKVSETMPGAAQAMLTTLITDIAKEIPKMLDSGLKVLMGVLEGIIGALPAILPIAVQMIGSLLGFILSALPLLLDAGIEIMLALVNGILPMLPMLIETALELIITLALGVAKALPQLIPAIVKIIPQIILILIKNLPLLIDAALQIILALTMGLIAAIPILIPEVPKIVKAIVEALIAALPMIGKAAVELIQALWQGIIDNLPKIDAAAYEIVMTLISGAATLLTSLVEMGADMVGGVWDGIYAQKDTFYSKVVAFFKGLYNAALSALGLGFLIDATADQQKAVGQAIQNGLGATAQQMNATISSFGSLAIDGNGGLASAAAAAPVQITFAPVVYTDLDMDAALQTLAEKIQRAR